VFFVEVLDFFDCLFVSFCYWFGLLEHNLFCGCGIDFLLVSVCEILCDFVGRWGWGFFFYFYFFSIVFVGCACLLVGAALIFVLFMCCFKFCYIKNCISCIKLIYCLLLRFNL